MFSLEDSLVNLLFNGHQPPHLPNIATLPCEILMSAKQALNAKSQNSVAAYLRCSGVVNNQLNKDLSLSLSVKKNLKSVNIRQSYKQERDYLVHFLRLYECWPGAHQLFTR